MRRLYRWLPGSPAVKGVLFTVIVVAAVAVLLVVFERAGDLLDNGGVIGP